MKSGLVLALVAALQGAAGVALAAAAAHVDANPLLGTASQFLMIHAAAGLGIGAFAFQNPPGLRWLIVGASTLQAGVTLFSADLAARVYTGVKLFPLAAPLGGGLTIVGWVGLAVWAAYALRSLRLDNRA